MTWDFNRFNRRAISPSASESIITNVVITTDIRGVGERTGLMVRASDSGSGDPGSILGRVGVFVSLSKRHLLPKSTGNTQE